MKPMIGIVPLVDEKRESYWMLPGYMKGIEQAGGIPVMLPLTSDKAAIKVLTDSFSGFIFTGGHDVNPKLYNEVKSEKCAEICTERDEMESILFEYVLEMDKPALGICRGLQFMNVHLGGTLYQDLPTEINSKLVHSQKPPYDKPVHDISIKKDSLLYKLLQKTEAQVNSCHHQGIKKLAPALKIMAEAEDGIIEAIHMPDKKFIMATQWHPEFSYLVNEDSRKIFKAFINACSAD